MKNSLKDTSAKMQNQSKRNRKLNHRIRERRIELLKEKIINLKHSVENTTSRMIVKAVLNWKSMALGSKSLRINQVQKKKLRFESVKTNKMQF